jgi:hypothetical protein
MKSKSRDKIEGRDNHDEYAEQDPERPAGVNQRDVHPEEAEDKTQKIQPGDPTCRGHHAELEILRCPDHA